MKKATKYLFNSLAGVLFIALLAVNVQVGSNNSFLGIEDFTIDQADAICEPTQDVCLIAEYPDGTTKSYKGQPIVITPEE